MLRSRLVVATLVAGTVLMFACGRNPDGYKVSDLKALPEANLLVPGSEILSRGEDAGSRWVPSGTSIRFIAGAQVTTEEVFDYYKSELEKRGWKGAGSLSSPEDLYAASWRSGDFGLALKIPDKSKSPGPTSWNGWTTVYQIIISTQRKKSN